MNTKTEVRDFMVEFLSRELIGPSVADEELDANNPPRRRYGAGVLFPIKSQLLAHEETASGEDDAEI